MAKINLEVSKGWTKRVFITVLFTTQKTRKQPECPMVGDQLESGSIQLNECSAVTKYYYYK